MHKYYMREMNPATLKLVLIYNNTLYWPPSDMKGPPQREPPSPASPYKIFFQDFMQDALAAGLKLPNVLFIYNSDDNIMRLGDPRRPLTAPPLSFVKTRGRPGGDDLDILVPQLMYLPRALYNSPWESKKDVAFFRGKYTCSHLWEEVYGLRDACPRNVLAYLSERDRRAGNATALDVGLTQTLPETSPESSVPYQLGGLPQLDLPVMPKVSIGRHAPHKWLLNLEGMVCAYRLSQLMTVNSLILHQRTPYIEYFYRSIRPGEHYLEFWNTTVRSDGAAGGAAGRHGGGGGGGGAARLLAIEEDVYGAVAAMRALERESPGRVHDIIRNSQQFAAKLLTLRMRMRYYRAALLGYKALFPDMDKIIESYMVAVRAQAF
ncbi:hypothetical protein HYH02_004929 [Chlamydomonas schloesseri]|uniref:Glycosyl transferase CAP10 domain-containing protein n=1 Tax=Chlamydomonas schloesseri TaxID=2026947 RepID=A0A836B813_9CHLO|nr:hypothetical protein HYH02_004929 [Chlamydomonas schloesseri]|eukprot:KAG2450427.1 hypothetical protein HYH02_004929 [Chlamydomonas schloesseri]